MKWAILKHGQEITTSKGDLARGDCPIKLTKTQCERFVSVEDSFDTKKEAEIYLGIRKPEKKEDDEAKKYPYHKGGGNYELSNGETVKGKTKAEQRQGDILESETE